MRKILNIFLAVLITLFSFPIGGLNVNAEQKTYDDIADGTYELTAKLLKEGTDETSAAAGFMSDQVTLEIKNGKAELTFFIPDNPAMEFKEFILEEEEPKLKSGTGKHNGEEVEGKYFTFPLNPVQANLTSTVTYSVDMPPLVFDHEGVVMDIQLVGLDELPPVEEEEQESTPESPEDNEKPENPDEGNKEDGKNESEDTESGEGSEEDSGDTEGEESEDETTEVEPLADGAYELSYTTEGADLSRYYEDKAIVIVDGDQQYLQLQGKSMRQFIEYLYIDGERMDISAATNEAGAYIAQFEMDEKVEENAPLAFDMVINAMGRIMAHGSKITLDLSSAENIDSAELIEGVPSEENEIFVTSTDSVAYEYDSGDVDLSPYYEDTINVLEKDGKQYIEFKGTGMANFIEALYVDGEKMAIEQNEDGSYIAQVEHEESLTEKFNFTMIINARGQIMSHSANIELIIPEEESDGGEGDNEEKSLTPDKAYEMDYTILHEDGNAPSVADGFFQKPGTVLKYDGKTYFQMTVESAEMVQALSNKYGDYVLVDEKDGTKTMQLRVPNDLSDMKLDMHIVVPAGAIPGFPGYDEEHGAILTFDKDSKKEISVEGLEIAASDNKNNGNGPFDEDAKTPPSTPTDPEDETNGKGNGKGNEKGNGKENGEGDDDKKSFKPEKAYEIMYTILHEDGKSVSVADDFFQKPGVLLEYKGKTYLQMTVESAEMVKSLSNKYGEYILVSNNDDGTMTIQLRVPNDLSDMKLDMHIVVPAGAIPGFPGYDEKHGAILTFDKDSKKEISVEGLEVAASGDKNNQNGPYDENATPGKPSLGDNDDDKKKKDEKTGNPKTGDTSQIFFFATLLMVSLGVLVVQVRRRLAA